MKWLLLSVAIMSVPVAAALLRQFPYGAPIAWFLMGLTPYTLIAIPHFQFALVSWPEWPGFVKGIELSGLDFIALALYLSLPRSQNPLPFRISMAMYFVAALLSLVLAEEPIAASFYCWQLARMFLIYAVSVKGCADLRSIRALLTGIGVGICFEAAVVVLQQFVFHTRPTGAFIHPNHLGTLSHFATFPFLALLLGSHTSFLTFAVPAAGGLIAALSTSRATAGLAALGYVIIFLTSAITRWTSRKALIGLIGAFALAILIPIGLYFLEGRFAEASLAKYSERDAYKAAAEAILTDHPMGIGANNYAYFSTVNGYSRAARVATLELGDSPHVHSIYWLAPAETGYVGLLALLTLLVRPLFVAFRCGWKFQNDQRGELLLGLGTSLLIVYVHSYFEWIFFTHQVQYMFAITIGMIAGLAQHLGYWRRPTRKRRTLRQEAGG